MSWSTALISVKAYRRRPSVNIMANREFVAIAWAQALSFPCDFLYTTFCTIFQTVTRSISCLRLFGFQTNDWMSVSCSSTGRWVGESWEDFSRRHYQRRGRFGAGPVLLPCGLPKPTKATRKSSFQVTRSESDQKWMRCVLTPRSILP